MSNLISYEEDGTVLLTHVSGFFSCCSIRLEGIINYFNDHSYQLPKRVDSREQWNWYRPPSFPSEQDMAFEYFVQYDDVHDNFPTHTVSYHHDHQFVDYRILSYDDLRPFIRKYFSLSPTVQSLAVGIASKYALQPDVTCVLFYRGNDKCRETSLCAYADMFEQADALLQQHPACKFLIQSDETEFLQQSVHRYGERAVVFWDEIRHMPRNPGTTVDACPPQYNTPYSKNFLAIVYLMAQCRWIVCTSGNCSVFTMYYRGCATNVRQYLNGEWLGSLVP